MLARRKFRACSVEWDLAILSTPRGILSGREARKQNVGGELLAYVW
jgi:ribosomal protein S8